MRSEKDGIRKYGHILVIENKGPTVYIKKKKKKDQTVDIYL